MTTAEVTEREVVLCRRYNLPLMIIAKREGYILIGNGERINPT